MREHPEQFTLGRLIDVLGKCTPGNACRFDFCMTIPTTLNSYRGYYEDIALGWKESETYPNPTVAEVLAILESSIGGVVHGYKGGRYNIHRGQSLFVANYSETGSTVIVGVTNDYQTVLRTLCASPAP